MPCVAGGVAAGGEDEQLAELSGLRVHLAEGRCALPSVSRTTAKERPSGRRAHGGAADAPAEVVPLPDSLYGGFDARRVARSRRRRLLAAAGSAGAVVEEQAATLVGGLLIEERLDLQLPFDAVAAREELDEAVWPVRVASNSDGRRRSSRATPAARSRCPGSPISSPSPHSLPSAENQTIDRCRTRLRRGRHGVDITGRWV